MRGVLAALVAWGCAFEPGAVVLGDGAAGGGDSTGGGDGAGGGDAAVADGIDLGPFMNVMDVVDTGYTDDDPSLTDDQLELFFGSTASTGPDEDVWTGLRDATGDDFTLVTLVEDVSTTDEETTPKVSANGLTLVFTRVSPTADVYIATRTARGDPWSSPSPVAAANSGFSEYSPFLLADDVTLIYCSDVTGNEEIYAITRPSPTADFEGPPVQLTGIGTGHDECDPMMPTPDVLYFTRSYTGIADTDIFSARRVDRAGWSFTDVARVDELTTAGRDRDPWVSADLRTIWFSSDRSGAFDIYMATR